MIALIKFCHVNWSSFIQASYPKTCRFSRNLWMSGIKRGVIGLDSLNDEIRIAYLKPDDEQEAVHLAQLEWAPWFANNLHRLPPSVIDTG